MFRFSGWCYVFFLLFLALSLPAQDAGELAGRQILHYGVEDGLSQGSIYAMLRDSRGFMWFTSNEGLNRFDGHDFRIYYAAPEDSSSLRGSLTLGVVEDPYGNIWTGTEHCLNRYLRRQDAFDFVYAEDSSGRAVSSIHYPFYADSTEVWYINEKEGLIAYNYHEGRKRRISDNFRYQWNSSIYNSTIVGADKNILIRKEEELALVAPSTGEVSYYFSAREANVCGPAYSFMCHYPARDSTLWLGVRGGVVHLMPGKATWTYYPIDTNVVVADIQQRSDGLLYLGTLDHGLYLFDPARGVSGHLHAGNSIFNNQSTATLYLDEQGILWINTDPEGLHVLYPERRGFQQFGQRFFETNGFRATGIRCFAETAEGQVWVGTEEDGIFLFEAGTGHILQHYQQNGPQGLQENHASTLHYDRRKRLWVGTHDGLYLAENGSYFKRLPIASSFASPQASNHIWDILETPDGILFFATAGGIFYTGENADQVYPLEVLHHLSTGDIELFGDYLLIPEYHHGFWVFNYRRWLESGGQERLFEQPMQEFNVKHFAPQGDSILWLATTTGLVKLAVDLHAPQFTQLRHYTKADGLPSEYLYGILWDADSTMWISSNRGLLQFDPATEAIRTFGPDEKIQGYEFNTNAFCRTAGGDLYFGGTQGFNYFHPPIDRNEVAPETQLVALTVNGKPRRTDPYIGEMQTLVLPYEDNTFTLHFRAVDYLSKGKNTYRARLTNYEQEWVQLGVQGEIRYTRVPPGRYVFEVIAANNDGLEQSAPRQLTIRILPPWWASWWAFALYAVLLGLMIAAIIRFRRRRRRLRDQLLREQAEAQRLKELDEFKSKVFTHITHEFRTPLTVIMGLSEELRSRAPGPFRDNLNRIWSNGQSLLSLVNQMLEMARLQAGHWPERLEQHQLQGFLQRQLDAHMDQAHPKHISLQAHIEGPQHPLEFDGRKWERILSNLLDNALKFTPDYGRIQLLAQDLTHLSPPRVQLSVEDTGAGISPELKEHIFEPYVKGPDSTGTGIGLALVKELVDTLDGTIEAHSQTGQGTRFDLSLPARQVVVDTLATPVEPALEEPGNSPEERAVLLIAEDNPDVLHYLQSVLTEEWQLLLARNGRDALELAVNQVPDIVLSDVMMPEMDGFELCRTLKSDRRTSHIPVLLLTAKADPKATLTGLRQGADAYLPKPIDRDELKQRLRNFLRLQKQNHRYWQETAEVDDETGSQAPPVEHVFLEQLDDVLEEHLSDTDLQIHDLCRRLGMSRTQLHRKLKAVTGLSTSRYIRRFRLRRARQLLQSTDLSVSTIAYETGFDNLSWFSQAYREAFGESPTASRRQQ